MIKKYVSENIGKPTFLEYENIFEKVGTELDQKTELKKRKRNWVK